MRLQELFDRYYNKTASSVERLELMQLIKEIPRDQLADLIRESGNNMDLADYNLSPETTNAILQKILQPGGVSQILPLDQSSEKLKIGRVRFLKKMAIAASILLIAGAGIYFFATRIKPTNSTNISPPMVLQQAHDALPGSYKAKLKLADGSTIVLDSMAAGKVALQNSTTVINRDGQLVYSNASSIVEGELVFNTLTTNKGETYSITLADGSRVWLNAASSIRFPVAFPGKERRIEITGEVYIKVAPLSTMRGQEKIPFIVQVNSPVGVGGMEVMALGTEFNINAYPDEASMNTTLIEGSVKVSKSAVNTPASSGGQPPILIPGQQAQFADNDIVVQSVNTDEIISWKEGWFHFESANLKTILRQFARWYDVEVVYEGSISNRKFFGIVQRNNTLLNVLEMLRDNNIKFRIAGKRLHVISG